MLAELLKLPEQPLQRRPTMEFNPRTGVLVKSRAMVLGVLDIQAHLDKSLVHRRLFGFRWFQEPRISR